MEHKNAIKIVTFKKIYIISIFGASVSFLVSHEEGRRYIAVLIFCPSPNGDSRLLCSDVDVQGGE